MLTVMVVECCGCGAEMGVKDGRGVSGTTSTICTGCVERLYPAYAEEFKALQTEQELEVAA